MNRVRCQIVGIVAFVCALSLGAFGQARLVALSNPSPSVVPDVNSSLFELTRVVTATDHDLQSSHLGGGMSHWLTFWRRDSARKAQVAASIRRNLQLAVPSLIQKVQGSNGSISSTFKLYNDLSVVCESLDSLVSSGGEPDKVQYPKLSNDLADMNRVRDELSAHIQQEAALLESENPEIAAGSRVKIISDEAVPEKRTKKRHISAQ